MERVTAEQNNENNVEYVYLLTCLMHYKECKNKKINQKSEPLSTDLNCLCPPNN